MSDTSGLDNFWGTSSVGDGQVQENLRMQYFTVEFIKLSHCDAGGWTLHGDSDELDDSGA